MALIAWRRRATAAIGPQMGQAALLADTRFILPPEFNRLVTGMLGDDRADESGEVHGMARPSLPGGWPDYGRPAPALRPAQPAILPVARWAPLLARGTVPRLSFIWTTVARSSCARTAALSVADTTLESATCSRPSGPWRSAISAFPSMTMSRLISDSSLRSMASRD